MSEKNSNKGQIRRMAPSDNKLMEDVRDGRVEKLAILFERYQVILYNFFLRLTAKPNVSEDLVQEVFIRILKYRAGYLGQSRFAVWMFQIARNAHIDHLRKQKAEIPLDEQFEETPASGPLPDEILESEQNAALMRRAMDQLPWRKREILMLSRFEDLKLREIAELRGCEVGTVKAQIHRALKDLGRIYLELQEGGTT